MYVTVKISPWLMTESNGKDPFVAAKPITPEAISKSYSKTPESGAVSSIVAAAAAKLADSSEPLLITT